MSLNSGKKLVVFPNDPIISYYKKGEITERYFNPGNYFDEVHIISFAKEEIEPGLVQCIAGNAKLEIHIFSKICLLNFIGVIFDYIKILRMVKKIKPHVIRSYNPYITGSIAISISNILKIPSVVSIHTNPDKDIRHHLLAKKKYLKYLLWYFMGKLIEPYVLKKASRVVCVYKFILDYAINKRGHKNGTVVIYNKIDSNQFKVNRVPEKKKETTILAVGRLYDLKNPENIIKAVTDLKVQLVIIGDGPYYDKLLSLVEELGLTQKVNFLKRVPNTKIHSYYASADIFASVNYAGGISKTVLEAINASLPVIVQQPIWEKTPELIKNCSIVVKDTPEGFKEAFQELINNFELRYKMGERARELALTISGSKMERKEKEVYNELIVASSAS